MLSLLFWLFHSSLSSFSPFPPPFLPPPCCAQAFTSCIIHPSLVPPFRAAFWELQLSLNSSPPAALPWFALTHTFPGVCLQMLHPQQGRREESSIHTPCTKPWESSMKCSCAEPGLGLGWAGSSALTYGNRRGQGVSRVVKLQVELSGSCQECPPSLWECSGGVLWWFPSRAGPAPSSTFGKSCHRSHPCTCQLQF